MAEKQDRWVKLRCSYPNSDKGNSVSFQAETMFFRLLTKADDQSVYDASPELLVAGLFAKRWENRTVSVSKAARWRNELVTADLVRVWKDPATQREYLWIVNDYPRGRSDVKPDIRYPSVPKEVLERGPDAGRMRAESVTLEESRGEENRREQHGSPDGDGCEGFEKWWKSYPRPKAAPDRKKHKADCLKVWQRAQYEALADKIIAFLETCKKSKDWRKDDGQYIPGPLPWLRGAPWQGAHDPLDSPVKPQMKEEPPDDSTVFARMTPQAVRQKFYQEAERRMPQHENRSLVWGLAQTLWIKAGRPKEAKP